MQKRHLFKPAYKETGVFKKEINVSIYQLYYLTTWAYLLYKILNMWKIFEVLLLEIFLQYAHILHTT